MTNENENENSIATNNPPIEVNPPPRRPVVSAEKPKQVLGIAASFTGPIPPPSLLADYERISPGLSDRIFSMAEDEAKHRRTSESAIITAHIDDRKCYHAEAQRGQMFALIITLSALVVGAYTACQGHEVTGGILGVGGIGGIVTTFIWGRSKQRLEEAERKLNNTNGSPNKQRKRQK